MDETHHFVFLIEGVPVRFFRGDASEPNKRALRQQKNDVLVSRISNELGSPLVTRDCGQD